MLAWSAGRNRLVHSQPGLMERGLLEEVDLLADAAFLQNELAQVLFLQNRIEPLAHEGAVDDGVFVGAVGGFVADLFHHPFQNRMQPSGADVL